MSTVNLGKMRRFAPVFFAALFVSAAQASERLDCASAAKAVMIKMPGQLLSVEADRQICTIVFLVHREGERPQKMTVQVQNGLSGPNSAKLKGEILILRVDGAGNSPGRDARRR